MEWIKKREGKGWKKNLRGGLELFISVFHCSFWGFNRIFDTRSQWHLSSEQEINRWDIWITRGILQEQCLPCFSKWIVWTSCTDFVESFGGVCCWLQPERWMCWVVIQHNPVGEAGYGFHTQTWLSTPAARHVAHWCRRPEPRGVRPCLLWNKSTAI